MVDIMSMALSTLLVYPPPRKSRQRRPAFPGRIYLPPYGSQQGASGASLPALLMVKLHHMCFKPKKPTNTACNLCEEQVKNLHHGKEG